jgi:hypothetical protein
MNIPRDSFIGRLLSAAGIVAFLIVAWTCERAPSSDFRAFYCAGSVVAAHQDPYRIEPLRTCEARNGRGNYILQHGGVMPVPLPSYDLAAFALLARLPYAQAKTLWQVLLWSAVAVGILALRRLTDLPLAVAIAALLFSQGYTSSVTGNVAAFSCTGLILAMLHASRGRHAYAAASLALAMSEPHIGIGALITAFFFIPTMRVPIVACAAMLAALTYATTGLASTATYLHEVLPRHAFSEIAHEEQFSLTALLHLLRLSDDAAVASGGLSFVLMLLCGILVGARLRDRFNNDAFLIAIPAAFSVIGGPFMHYVQLAAALPAALLLHENLPKQQIWLGRAIMLLATPWIAVVGLQNLVIVLLLSIGLLCWRFTPDIRAAIYAWFVQASILFAGAATFRYPTLPQAFHIALPGTAYSEDAWRIVTDTLLSQRIGFYTMLKIPTWCGLLILAGIALKAARERPKPYPAGP